MNNIVYPRWNCAALPHVVLAYEKRNFARRAIDAGYLALAEFHEEVAAKSLRYAWRRQNEYRSGEKRTIQTSRNP